MTDAAPQRFRATLAYDGTAYLGFQRQAGDAPTIQGCVEAALQRLTGQPVSLIGAGRTDTGVHARGQVIAFTIDWRHEAAALARALNSLLPDDIAVTAVQPCAADFHPRYDAAARRYRYRIVTAPTRQPLLRHAAWWLWSPLEAAALDAAAARLIGTYDCAAFGHPPQGTNTIRTITESAWTHTADPLDPAVGHWTYTITANAFLHHMVRRIVGMLADVGRGGRTIGALMAAVEAAVLVKDWTTAPPHGLTLEAVIYPAERHSQRGSAGEQKDQDYAGETPAGGR